MTRTVRPQTTHPITLRELEVIASEPLGPGMHRLVLGGVQMHPFTRDGAALPGFVSEGFDDEIKVFLPDPVTGDLVVPAQRERHLEWPRDPRLVSRTYTVRAVDPAAATLTVDLVRHGGGVAASWAATCRPGDAVWIAGPKLAWLHPADTDWLLIAGDETALPAIARWLEEMPPSTRGQVFLEVAARDHELALAAPAGVEVTWLHRDGRPAGTTALLADAIAAAPWWPGPVFAWVAGEAGCLRPVRRFLRTERGLPPERVEVTGYWKLPVAVHDAAGAAGPGATGGAADLPADPAPVADDGDHGDHAAGGLLGGREDLVTPHALRTAVTLELVPRVLAGTDTPAALAAATGADPRALAKLLRHLAVIGVLEVVREERAGAGGPRYAVTAAGAELDDEEEVAELDLRTAAGRRGLSIAGLHEAVTTGGASSLGSGGRSPAQERADDPVLDAAAAALAAAELDWVASSFCAEVAFAPEGRVTVVGDGALRLLAPAMVADPALEVALVDLPSRVAAGLSVLPAALRPRVRVLEGSPLGAWSAGGGPVLLAGALREHPDADAVLLLRSAALAAGPRAPVLLLEEELDDTDLDDHATGEDLLLLCLHGSGLRTPGELRALVDRAGLVVTGEQVVGWGERVLALGPR